MVLRSKTSLRRPLPFVIYNMLYFLDVFINSDGIGCHMAPQAFRACFRCAGLMVARAVMRWPVGRAASPATTHAPRAAVLGCWSRCTRPWPLHADCLHVGRDPWLPGSIPWRLLAYPRSISLTAHVHVHVSSSDTCLRSDQSDVMLNHVEIVSKYSAPITDRATGCCCVAPSGRSATTPWFFSRLHRPASPLRRSLGP